MLIHKITTGFVTQTFNTETGKYISQEFTAGDPVEYEDEFRDNLTAEKMATVGFGPQAPNGEPYLPFDMVQPANI